MRNEYIVQTYYMTSPKYYYKNKIILRDLTDGLNIKI